VETFAITIAMINKPAYNPQTLMRHIVISIIPDHMSLPFPVLARVSRSCPSREGSALVEFGRTVLMIRFCYGLEDLKWENARQATAPPAGMCIYIVSRDFKMHRVPSELC
jgi:hypothetical protein